MRTPQRQCQRPQCCCPLKAETRLRWSQLMGNSMVLVPATQRSRREATVHCVYYTVLCTQSTQCRLCGVHQSPRRCGGGMRRLRSLSNTPANAAHCPQATGHAAAHPTAQQRCKGAHKLAPLARHAQQMWTDTVCPGRYFARKPRTFFSPRNTTPWVGVMRDREEVSRSIRQA